MYKVIGLSVTATKVLLQKSSKNHTSPDGIAGTCKRQIIKKDSKYSCRRLLGSRLIESSAYCNQIWLAHLYIDSAQHTSVNWIIRLLLSLLCRPKVIILSGGHCIWKIDLNQFMNYPPPLKKTNFIWFGIWEFFMKMFFVFAVV